MRKIFNRNTLKVSYACMPNIATTISSHNQKVLSGAEERQRLCNCRDKSRCPLSGNCQQQSIIYQATVVTDSRQETYIGLTEQTFKTRYNNHTSSFNNVKYKNATELSKHVWELKTKNVSYKLQWKILFRSPAYKPPSKTCHLCLTEKYCIICRSEWCTLNSRNELASSCRHRNKFLLTPSILKNIPLAINRRLCTISSDEHSFNSEVQPYQQALIASGYKHVLEYNKDSTTPNTTSEKQRARNIVWYNPHTIKPPPPILAENFLTLYTTPLQRNTY